MTIPWCSGPSFGDSGLKRTATLMDVPTAPKLDPKDDEDVSMLAVVTLMKE